MLKDRLNWSEIMVQPRYAGGHEEIMRVLFKDSKVLFEFVEDDYEGTEAFVYEIDGNIILVTDYFGSCSGCDAYEFCTDEELKNLVIQLANNAQIFRTKEGLKNFLSVDVKEEPGSYYAEGTIAGEVLAWLEDV